MGTKTSATASVQQATTPGEIRNVVLVGHSGGGKTTLFEHLVAATTPGYRAKPTLDERSVQLAVASVAHEGVVLNLIDTPGYPDFVGELRAGLRAADAALFVISASDGVDGATMLLWEECAAIGMPRAVAVTKLDAGRADFEDTVAICQRVFGAGCHGAVPAAAWRRRGDRRQPRALDAADLRLQLGRTRGPRR